MTTTSSAASSVSTGEQRVGPAARVIAPRWGSPRLWLGLILVIASVVGVVAVVSASDDRVGVWAVRSDLGAGATLTSADLKVVMVRVPDVALYLTGSTTVVGGTLTRDLAAGELLPSAAVAPADQVAQRLVTIPVDRFHAPADLARGDQVDVYLVLAGPTGQPVGDPVVVAKAATVAAVEDDSGGFGGSSSQTGVVLTLAPQQVAGLVAASARGSLTLVRVPSGT